ncbi:MAG: hypothetical protein KIT00_12765 [Rhodospirillales bacterium]|nr:hypothetical protein [Rhodospirillales bacterium]
MSSVKFTAAEMATFLGWFERNPSWTRWLRRDGANGSDVLEIAVSGRRPTTLSLTKGLSHGYLATGFDGWGLTVCDEFAEMLGILAGYGAESGQSNTAPVAA